MQYLSAGGIDICYQVQKQCLVPVLKRRDDLVPPKWEYFEYVEWITKLALGMDINNMKIQMWKVNRWRMQSDGKSPTMTSNNYSVMIGRFWSTGIKMLWLRPRAILCEASSNTVFIFVIVCGLFEWKANLCRFFFLSFVDICIVVGDPVIKKEGLDVY